MPRRGKADRFGNLMFRKTARNFNPMAITAGKIAVVEVEEIVEVGELDPDEIHLPGIYVNRLIKGSFEKRIEQRTVAQCLGESDMATNVTTGLTREQIAQRVAQEFQDGYYVNLGIGIPYAGPSTTFQATCR